MLVTAGPARTSTAAQNPKAGHDPAQMHLYPAAELKWASGPGSLPAGAQFVVLEGDPSKDGLFTMRVFAWAQRETVLQLHGVGPRTVTNVNPADDPHRK